MSLFFFFVGTVFAYLGVMKILFLKITVKGELK